MEHSSIHFDKIIMERIASASQEKVYPSVQPKSETSLRKVLLSSRIWEYVRSEEERLTAEIASATSEEDWWFDNNPTVSTVDDETLDALVSFASSNNDNSSVIDYSNNSFLPTSANPTTNSDGESISGDWSWLEEENKLMSNSQDVLSHTNSFIDMASLEEDEITEEEKLIAALINTTDSHDFLLHDNTLPSPPEEEHDLKLEETKEEEEEWLPIPIVASPNEVSTKDASSLESTKSTGIKRQREEGDGQEKDIKPTKKLLVDTTLTKDTKLTTKSYPAGPTPPSPIASSLLRV